MNLEWAETNRGIILAAVAKTLGLPPGQVLVEFVLRKKNSGGATARRLQELPASTAEGVRGGGRGWRGQERAFCTV